jgi:ribonuclease BN (tRNA processing enzyme)
MKTSTVSRFLLVLLAVAALVAAGAALFQRQVGLAVAKRMIDRRAAIDLAAEQPDGLHVGLCGSGSPMPDPGRAGPCVFVIAGERLYVVDAGDGATRKMALMGVQIGRIDAILLTHFHSDHIGGLGEMMLVRWASAGNSEPRITADIPSYHTTPEEAAKLASQAGVRHLVFYHIVPPVPHPYLDAAFLGDAGDFYDGPITVGTDGLLFVMPAESDVIRLRKLL